MIGGICQQPAGRSDLINFTGNELWSDHLHPYEPGCSPIPRAVCARCCAGFLPATCVEDRDGRRVQHTGTAHYLCRLWRDGGARRTWTVAAGIRPGEVVGIFLPNCWEFGVAYHAATLAGAIPTTLNPTYRDREVRYQLENSDAVALISDGALLTGIDLSLLPLLRRVYTVRAPGPSGSQPFDSLFEAAEKRAFCPRQNATRE